MPSMTLTCLLCNLPMDQRRDSAPQGEAAHRSCRKAAGGIGVHGVSGYRRGCRCDTCRLAQNASVAEYARKRKERDGVGLTARWRQDFKAKHGYWPQRGGGDWIAPKARRAIYDRDGLACYICGDQLDRLTEINDPKAPTIDHVVPRSKGGTDDLDNLKTCCRDCNVRKSDSMPAEALLLT